MHKDNKNRQLNMSGADERELEEALKRSLEDYNQQNEGEGAPSMQVNKKEDQFEAFKGTGISLNDQQNNQNYDNNELYMQYNEDPELAYVLKLSMQEEQNKQLVIPEEPGEGDEASSYAVIQFRLPNAKKLQRKFFLENLVQDLINYIKKECNKTNVKLIKGGFPKKVLDNGNNKLEQEGFQKQEQIIVEFN